MVNEEQVPYIVIFIAGVRDLFTERSVLKKCSHPCVVKLHYTFQSDNSVYFILDYLPGSSACVRQLLFSPRGAILVVKGIVFLSATRLAMSPLPAVSMRFSTL